MVTEEEGKCAVIVTQPPGFADRLFVLVLLKLSVPPPVYHSTSSFFIATIV